MKNKKSCTSCGFKIPKSASACKACGERDIEYPNLDMSLYLL